MRGLLTVLVLVACSGGDTTDSADCVVLEDRFCGNGAGEGEDTACPEGFSCWGPSAFVCYQGSECNLPICLASAARIATPRGPIAVIDLEVGDPVFSQDPDGQRIVAAVAQVGSTLAPQGHQLVRLRLDDDRTVQASPGHPTTDGRLLGDLRVGDTLDGALVLAAERVPYTGRRTYDLRPNSPTGAYWADGVLLGSTLTPRAPAHQASAGGVSGG